MIFRILYQGNLGEINFLLVKQIKQVLSQMFIHIYLHLALHLSILY